jgi:hypothetical protein
MSSEPGIRKPRHKGPDLNTNTASKLEAVRLDRADRYEKTAKNLMRLAWSIEGMAVLIGLSIAFSRVQDANQTGTANVTFWGGIQLMGGFIIVSMGELTKIPLSMLLVNGRLLLKPLVFLVLLFVSAITFETVFLSLERGYDYQKADIHEYRDELRVAQEALDTETERTDIDRIDGQIRSEQAYLERLAGDNLSNLAFIETKYSGDGDAAKPNDYDGAEAAVADLTADLEKLAVDYKAKLDVLTSEMSSAAAIFDESGALGAGSLDARSPELVALDESIERLQVRKKALEDELVTKLNNIQSEYDAKRLSFQQSIDRATAIGNTKEAARYQTLIERLAPKVESEKARASLEPQIEDLNKKISDTLGEREAIALRDAKAKGTVVSETAKERTQAVDDARRAASEQRDALTREMQARRDALSTKLSEAQRRLDTLNDTWRADRDALALVSATAKKQEIADELARYSTAQAEKRAVIEDLRASQLRLSQDIRTAEKMSPELRADIGEKQRLLCGALLGNQIFRISTRIDASSLFGVERSAEEAALIGKPDTDCPTQIHVDEGNADRVAFIWFGSIALLAATAGAANAITAQGFLRMAETLRWQPPKELAVRKGFLSGSLRRALVRWSWRRTKTVEVERIREVQVEVIKPYETIREVENIIREIVPVPVFVPTGGDVEAEMAKVRGNYEEMNRMAREAAVPSQRTVVPYASTASESKPQQGRGGHPAAAAATDEEVASTNHDEVAAEAPSELADVAELDAANDSGEGGDEAKPADPEKKVEMTV